MMVDNGQLYMLPSHAVTIETIRVSIWPSSTASPGPEDECHHFSSPSMQFYVMQALHAATVVIASAADLKQHLGAWPEEVQL